GWRMSLADCTLPPTRMRWGVGGFSSFFTGGGGGGGGAADGTAPRIPPMTPPGAPPGTPPGTPPTTPTAPAMVGGSSSSLIMAMSLGICFGAMSLPASNWRGMTLTTLTGGAAAGGGGGGGGGGGATR